MSHFHIMPSKDGDGHYMLKIVRPDGEIIHGSYIRQADAVLEAREMGHEEADAGHAVDIAVFDRDGNTQHVPL